MIDSHTQSKLLLEYWQELNATCFNSALIAPSSIGWLNLSAEADLPEDFGYYFPRQNGIALSHRFQYAEEQHVECKRLAVDSSLSAEQKLEALAKFNAVEIVHRLLAHEMIHQAAHQAGDSGATHGAPFLKHAQAVAVAFEIPGPTHADAHQWPSIQYFLALEVQAGHVSA